MTPPSVSTSSSERGKRRLQVEDILSAAHNGDLETIKRVALFDRNAVLTVYGTDGCNPALIACKKGHLQIVRFLFDLGACITDEDKDPKRQGNALHYAAWGGQLEVVQWLLAHGASLDTVDVVGNTALLYAVYGGHMNVVNYILSLGRSLQERNSKNHTALLQAACGGHLELVDWLLHQGFSIDEADLDGNTSLLFAAWGGHLKLVHYLLANGASLREQNYNGHSIFLSAANGGRVEIVEWLIGQGFPLTEVNNNGDTALLLAAYGGHRRLVQRLLELGANLHDRNACGFTPLLSAANGGQLEMSQWLLENGSQLSEADYDGYTSLILAACGGNIDLVKFFISKGASLKEQNSNGDTALLLASYCGNRDLVDWLLRNGSSLDEKNFTGMGALVSAANGGSTEVVELLLQRISEYGPDCGDSIESMDEGGYTPLLLAAQRGHLDVVKLLAKYGANLHAVTNTHQNNAIVLAGDFPEVQQYLQKIWNWRPLQIAVDLRDFERTFALVQVRVDTTNGYSGPTPLELARSALEDHVTHTALKNNAGQVLLTDRTPVGVEFSPPGTIVPLEHSATKESIPVQFVQLLRNARLSWAPARHQLFPEHTRRMVFALALIVPRISSNVDLPLLPSEMWMHIMSFLCTGIAPRGAERGWLASTRTTPLAISNTQAASAQGVLPSLEFCDVELWLDDDDDMVDADEGRRARNSTSKLRCRELFPEDNDMDVSDEAATANSGSTLDDVGVLAFSASRRFSWV